MNKILDVINQILYEKLEKKRSINLEDKLMDCLNSLDFIRLIINIEEKFAIEFPIEKLDNKEFTTVESFVLYLENIINTTKG